MATGKESILTVELWKGARERGYTGSNLSGGKFLRDLGFKVQGSGDYRRYNLEEVK